MLLLLGVLYELELRKLVNIDSYVFARDISVELISILNDGAFEGVVIGSKAVRQYNTDYAAHILGRVGKFESREERDSFNAAWNAAREAGEDTTGLPYYRLDDQVGKDGVELAFEQYLRGRDGTRLITTNQEGKITSEREVGGDAEVGPHELQEVGGGKDRGAGELQLVQQGLAHATTQVTTTKTVETSRGIITDRNGKVLVSNQEIYTASFDPDLVPDQEGESHQAAVARALLRILTLFQVRTVEPVSFSLSSRVWLMRGEEEAAVSSVLDHFRSAR